MLRVAVFLFFLQEYNCYLVSLPNVSHAVSSLSRPINRGDAPEYFDWRDKHMVSPVKDQGTCAACWAFSTVAAIESHLKIYRNVELTLSEQFLLDCEEFPSGGKRGCKASSLIEVFADIVSKFGGVLQAKDYRAYASQPLECRWRRSINDTHYWTSLASTGSRQPAALVPVVGFRRVRPYEDIMAEFVYKYGPLTAAINSASMADYSGGIDEPTPEKCDPKRLNHAVLIVGYNVYVSNTGVHTPYWIIKNSWGLGFGDHGFYYLVRGRNACGIASDVSFPYVE